MAYLLQAMWFIALKPNRAALQSWLDKYILCYMIKGIRKEEKVFAQCMCIHIHILILNQQGTTQGAAVLIL